MQVVNKTYLIVSTSVVLSGMILSWTYRPYIYANNINDFGFADTIGSLVSVIGFCCFVWAFKEYSNKEKNIHIILATIAYSFVWESLGLLGIHGTFDKKDIVAAFLSGLITFVVKNIVDGINARI